MSREIDKYSRELKSVSIFLDMNFQTSIFIRINDNPSLYFIKYSIENTYYYINIINS